MPPGRPAGSTNKTKAATFKPPRPISKSSAKTKTPPRRKSAPSRVPSSLQSSSSDDDADRASKTFVPEDTTTSPGLTHDAPPTIPPKLLTTLLNHHFRDEDTRIGKDANALVIKYMETFVREALARAAFEKNEAGERDFLEVGINRQKFWENYMLTRVGPTGRRSGETCTTIDTGFLRPLLRRALLSAPRPKGTWDHLWDSQK